VSAVLNGRVPTESGLRTLRSVAASTVESTLRSLIEAVGVPVIVHCCTPRPPLRLFQSAGAAAVAVDLALVGSDTAAQDELGELLDAGLGLFAGAVPTVARKQPPGAEQVAGTVTELWKRLSFTLDRLPEQVVITPACGLANATPGYARAALTTCAEAARRLGE
jgi:methionine synthase II (cobalamin-independent)